MYTAVLKPYITGKYSKNAKKQQPPENQRNTEILVEVG